MSEVDEKFRPDRIRRLILKPGRERTVSNRHPWIFSGAIEHEEGPPDAAIGELRDRRGTLLGSGLYSEHSQIRLRALAFGAPLTADMLRERIQAAIARRDDLGAVTTALRLINSEGDELSGLVVDRYGGALVAEVTSSGFDRLRRLIIEELQRTVRPRCIMFKNDLAARRLERLPLDDVIEGESLDRVEIVENGLRFLVSLAGGQKTGFFLDQRDNRALARDLSRNRDVLNLFAYSGAFGVYAAAGGARSVLEVDVSKPVIELAAENHRLNGSLERAELFAADAFDFTRKLVSSDRRFELVVCDPPAFAKSRSEVDRAARGYKDINLQSIKLVESGGFLMTFSCSGHISLDLFQKIIFSAALDSGRKVSILRRLGAGADHPVSLYAPEGEYLKGFLLRVE